MTALSARHSAAPEPRILRRVRRPTAPQAQPAAAAPAPRAPAPRPPRPASEPALWPRAAGPAQQSERALREAEERYDLLGWWAPISDAALARMYGDHEPPPSSALVEPSLPPGFKHAPRTRHGDEPELPSQLGMGQGQMQRAKRSRRR